MDHSITVDTSDQSIVWKFRRDDSGVSLFNHLEEAFTLLEGQPFVVLIDLCAVRYILPDDKKVILQMISQSKVYDLVGLAYLVDFRNYKRMQLLVSLNQLPYEEVVFKNEMETWEYLHGLIKKRHRKVY
jgi:hypothetical protein